MDRIVNPAQPLLLVCALGSVLLGCGPETGARLDPLEARTALVGAELRVSLHVDSDATLRYDSDIEDLATRRRRPTLTAYAGGEAIFRWTPLADDVGDHRIRFSAQLGGTAASTTLELAVVGGNDPLTFRAPVGDGTTLDTARTPCVEVEVIVEDTASTKVTLERGAIWSANGELTQDGPLTGTLRFCPTKAQAQGTGIFPFSIVARDGQARAEKRYTIVLGTLTATSPPTTMTGPTMPGCDAAAPSITHTPHPDITTSSNLRLYATVADAAGVYDATVFYTTVKPADPTRPDLAQMDAVDMLFVGGTATASQFGVTLFNPTTFDPPGTTRTVYYVIRATDADDGVAGCKYHTTLHPTTGVHRFVVKRAP